MADLFRDWTGPCGEAVVGLSIQFSLLETLLLTGCRARDGVERTQSSCGLLTSCNFGAGVSRPIVQGGTGPLSVIRGHEPSALSCHPGWPDTRASTRLRADPNQSGSVLVAVGTNAKPLAGVLLPGPDGSGWPCWGSPGPNVSVTFLRAFLKMP